ncbi:Fungal Zn binuclear cluster domain containing protein [Macrophomina phaseolina MS6]|uniref:Fungal Zn binuclear cluster domain containing protein n=1 Tax=Macrophomina phaseolina (strain MS6) TaxID=1126212 RepID=K2R568_MACPH|nr:Fungal Zn binuclear cluster domain containing protein [Macrophomina phaseolina MS6]
MQPLFPIVDERYQNLSHRKSLITHDHVLCLAILTVASRYVWFEGTSASSRAHEIHTLLFKQAQQGFHNSLWGVEHDAAQESRVLSTVESIVLFVEWRPRPMDVMPNQGMDATAMDVPGVGRGESQNCVIDEETQKAYLFARRMNATSWRLLGHAIHLLDEIGLVEGLSKPKESRQHDAANLRRRARIRDLLVPLVWEVSFRLGRESLLKLPKSAGAEEYSGENVFSPLLRSRTELYRLCRLIENTLYSSASATKDIIASDRHPEMVSSLAEIMHDWRNKFQRQPGPLALRKSIEIQYHSIWTYLHAISFQAIVERLRHSSGNEAAIRHFERSYQPLGLSVAEVLRSERSRRDIQSTDEIAKASIRALELTLELEHEGYLRFIPSSTMIHISTSATLLLKGLRAVTDRSTSDLLSRLSRAMQTAAVDDAHAMAHFSSGLSSIVKKFLAGTPNVYRNGRQYANTPQDTATVNQPAAINLPPMGAENAGVANGAVSEQASFAGSGGVFDPIFPDDIAEDWANWLSVGLDDIDSRLGLNLYSSCGVYGEILRP